MKILRVFLDEELSKYPAGIYLPKVNNRNTRTTCETYSKLTIKIPERYQHVTACWVNAPLLFEKKSQPQKSFFVYNI